MPFQSVRGPAVTATRGAPGSASISPRSFSRVALPPQPAADGGSAKTTRGKTRSVAHDTSENENDGLAVAPA
eukprot:7987850-Pyramimonas_sp.AAC.1